MVRTDSFINTVTGAGVENVDKRMSTRVGGGRLGRMLNEPELTKLWIYNRQAQRAAEVMPEHATREWITFKQKGNPQVTSDVTEAMGNLALKDLFFEASTWGQLYGGAVIVMGLDDGLDASEPLDLARLRKIDFLRVLNRWQLNPCAYYDKQTDPQLGEPSVYQIYNAGKLRDKSGKFSTFKVHASRILRFDGVMLPFTQRQANSYWHGSIMDALLESLMDMYEAYGATSTLLHDFSVPIWKMKGLYEAVRAGRKDEIAARVRAQQLALSMLNAFLLDADSGEAYERKTTQTTGLPEIIEKFKERWASDVNVPMTIMFGQMAGKIAGAEQDETSWNKSVSAWQQKKYEKNLTYFFKVLFACSDGPTKGKTPEGWEYAFKELKQVSPQEKALLRKTKAEEDQIYIQAGVLDPAEVAVSRFGGDEYSDETKIDMDARGAKEAQREIDEKRTADEAARLAKEAANV